MNIKNKSITIIFLKEDDHCIAVIQNNQIKIGKMIRCYTFIDQHNEGALGYFKSLSIATKEEYQSLYDHMSYGPYSDCNITVGTKEDIF
jgi:hypothetical protein